jgi:5,10-methylenetetrahydromethanopterin reductase
MSSTELARAGEPVDGKIASRWALWLHAVRPVPQLVELAQTAERLGAYALLLADEGIDRDIYVTFAAIATATSRIRLVPSITNPHSRHPVATAAAMASLEELAPGRTVLGLGAGGSLVFDPMGIRPAKPFSAVAEAVEVVDDLLGGQTVDHAGQFTVRAARLPWSPGRLPIAIAGRGPRMERLAGERADWVIVAGKAVEELPALSARVRQIGADYGRSPWVVWNPSAAWTPEFVEQVRPHFAYMTVDSPPEERRALGITDEQVERIRHEVHRQGPEAAAHLIPDSVVNRFAVVGHRDEVVARLRWAVGAFWPELIAFGAHEYTVAHVADIAALAGEVGLLPSTPAGADRQP